MNVRSMRRIMFFNFIKSVNQQISFRNNKPLLHENFGDESEFSIDWETNEDRNDTF